MPDVRQRIIAGQLHRFQCSACGRTFTVEKQFLYTDFRRNTVILVQPRQEKHRHAAASAVVRRWSGRIPKSLWRADTSQYFRVVMGLAELREKLIAQDANWDDRVVELLKVLMLHEHPFLLHIPRLQLVLHRIGDATVDFTAASDRDPRRFLLRLPRSVTDAVADNAELMNKWSHASAPQSLLAAPVGSWVSVARLSPQPDAIARLQGGGVLGVGGGVDDDNVAAVTDGQPQIGCEGGGAHLGIPVDEGDVPAGLLECGGYRSWVRAPTWEC